MSLENGPAQRPIARRRRIAYVFTDIPDQAGIFSFAELDEMSRRGFEIEIFCLRTRLTDSEGGRDLLRRFRVHREGYLSPRALGALVRLAARHPGRFLRSLAAAIVETAPQPRLLFKTLGVLPKCCLFALEMPRSRVDWIQAYWASLPGRAAWWISRFTGIPYGCWAHAGADIYNRGYQTLPALRRTLGEASLVLTCNRKNVDYFEQVLDAVTLERVHYQPHGIDVAFFAHTDAPRTGGECIAARAGQETTAPEIRLLSVGRLSATKGFHVAVDACRILRDRGLAFRYRIIGGGREHEPLDSLIRRFGLEGSVTLLPPCAQADLVPQYQWADLFLVPSIVGRDGERDGLPNVVLEAMASGRTVIGSDAVGIPEAVLPDRTGQLVPPGDPVALADAIEKLARFPEERRRLAEGARRLVEERYARERCMDGLAGILSAAIPAPRAEDTTPCAG